MFIFFPNGNFTWLSFKTDTAKKFFLIQYLKMSTYCLFQSQMSFKHICTTIYWKGE